MSENDFWVRIRVPLSALERAIVALKERVIALHQSRLKKNRDEANSDEEAAEAIKRSLREDSENEH